MQNSTFKSDKKNLKRLLLVISSILLLSIGFWYAEGRNVLQELGRFPLWTICLMLVFFILNLLVVSFRSWRLLACFGIYLPRGVVFNALLQSWFLSLFMISLVGQIIGLHAVLRNHGVSSIVSAMLVIVERFVMFFVCGSLCLFGIIWLLDITVVSGFFDRFSFFQACMVIFLSLMLSIKIGRSKYETELLPLICSVKSIKNSVTIGLITLISQTLILGAFVLLGTTLAPDAKYVDLLAAAAITSFAASMPISIGGWGVRELVAVFAFGKIGIPAPSAMAISILIGLGSTGVILAAYPLIFRKSLLQSKENEQFTNLLPGLSGHIPIEKIGVLIISIAVGVLVFFQFHVTLFSTDLSLNFSDAFALIALTTVVIHCIGTRTFPVWRIREFNIILLLFSGLLVFSFFWGVRTIGVTQWALSGRLFGWLILLGYLSIGLLTISYLGLRGIRRFFETAVITASFIVLLQIIFRSMASLGWIDTEGVTAHFEGYAANRNAFAFQMLMCSILLVAYFNCQKGRGLKFLTAAYSSTHQGISKFLDINRNKLFVFFHGLVLVGIIFSGSRAGTLCAIILLLFSFFNWKCFTCRRSLLFSLICTVFIWIFSVYTVEVIAYVEDFVHDIQSAQSARKTLKARNIKIQSNLSSAESDHVRGETILRGIEMWQNSPWLGAGLGVFIAKSTRWYKEPIVIHCTPVWLLAEFGIIGLLIVFSCFVRIIVLACQRWRTAPQYRVIVLLLGVFSIFCLVHEIFYQRIFWLMLGMCLALPLRAFRIKKPELLPFNLRESPDERDHRVPRLLFVVNDAGYFLSHRLPIAVAVQNAGFEVHIAAPERNKKEVLREYGFAYHPWPLTRSGKNPFFEIMLIWKLARIFRHVKPDILHLITIKPMLYGGIAARLTSIGTVVAAVTGLGFIFSNNGVTARVLRFLVSMLYRTALSQPRLCVIFQNNDDAKIVSCLAGLKPENMCLIRGAGVNLTEYAFESLPLDVGLPIVVLAARLLKPKGVLEFVAAAQKLRERGIKARFVLVGLPDEKNPETVSKDFIAACVEGGIVEHWGHRSDMPEILRRSSLVVLPSYREGMPKVLLEAAASGRAVITTDAPGCRDAIIPGVTGLLVPPRDAGALADAMERLLCDRERLQTMGKAGRELAEREFDVRGVVDRHLEIYRELLAKKEIS